VPALPRVESGGEGITHDTAVDVVVYPSPEDIPFLRNTLTIRTLAGRAYFTGGVTVLTYGSIILTLPQLIDSEALSITRNTPLIDIASEVVGIADTVVTAEKTGLTELDPTVPVDARNALVALIVIIIKTALLRPDHTSPAVNLTVGSQTSIGEPVTLTRRAGVRVILIYVKAVIGISTTIPQVTSAITHLIPDIGTAVGMNTTILLVFSPTSAVSVTAIITDDLVHLIGVVEKGTGDITDINVNTLLGYPANIALSRAVSIIDTNLLLITLELPYDTGVTGKVLTGITGLTVCPEQFAIDIKLINATIRTVNAKTLLYDLGIVGELIAKIKVIIATLDLLIAETLSVSQNTLMLTALTKTQPEPVYRVYQVSRLITRPRACEVTLNTRGEHEGHQRHNENHSEFPFHKIPPTKKIMTSMNIKLDNQKPSMSNTKTIM
jgi:hypothetical protein